MCDFAIHIVFHLINWALGWHWSYYFTCPGFVDPYLNTDAGTMSPFEHGEVFVLDDGGEVRFFRCLLASTLIFLAFLIFVLSYA
jgi:hypothetical protein